MPSHETDHLRSIKTFPQLVKYLRDELAWPIDSDDFDDLTFDYTAEELGLDHNVAVKVRAIKQLRPLDDHQPWGIFFVDFEPRRLPVVVLRRILRALVKKKRQSSNRPRQAVWDLHDLLFISSYGEQDHRDITFAHFSEDAGPLAADLPTLKVLGWDDEDTVAHLDHAHQTLRENLRWPHDPADLGGWRRRWSAAFTLRVAQAIRTSKDLAIRMAELATAIRRRVNQLLRVESSKGPLRTLMVAFREALIHDLSDDDFADMYAQTITYGLLSARVSRYGGPGEPGVLNADDAADLVPITNPFLRDLMETFLHVGGRARRAGRNGGGLDFDELGVSDVVEALRAADMGAVLRDFGDRNPQEDPVIHFYELFLKEYDPRKRMQRGVFYTPRPVVSYIVRSVHELLQTEFGLEDGLASTITWAEMANKHADLKIPDGTPPDSSFVTILDPATGTATFLVEVIDIIYRTMRARWLTAGHMELEIPKLWNEYVPRHLLPRLHGYELMMAPYAIAHMKIGLKLFETGYKFGSGERARIYLTNALEPPQDFSDTFEQMAPALAHEAKAVNDVKRHQRFTVVIGNPPYSGHSWNLTPQLRRAVEPYKFVDGRRIKEKGALQLEKSIQDDYVKFFRCAQVHITNSGIGLIGLVTSHGFLDNPFLRGMRWSLLSNFRHLFVLDLHGNALRHEKSPDGSDDTNIFDIKRTGAAISFLRNTGGISQATVQHAEIWGDRDATKYPWLSQNTIRTTPAAPVAPALPSFLLIPQNREGIEEYDIWCPLNEIMPLHSKGVVTGRDAFVIDFDEPVLLRRMLEFAESGISDEDMVEKYNLNPTAWWDVAEARRRMPRAEHLSRFVRPLLYRPFDFRPCFYHPAVFMSPRRPVMTHMDSGRPNLLLISSRMTKGECFQHVTVARGLAEAILLSSKTSNNAIVFPLHLNADHDEGDGSLALGQTQHPNFGASFVDAIRTCVGLKVVDGDGNFSTTIGAEDVLKYIVALLHSPTYRSRYASPLTRDFPRLPMTQSIHLLASLVTLGGELLSMHVLESPLLEAPINTYTGPAAPEVEKVSYAGGTIWLDKKQTCGFAGVPEAVWNFHIGGYQVCEKWLKDRRGRKLSKDDIAHYQKIVVALNETIRIMKEIDEVIERHGGWPGAFVTTPTNSGDTSAASPSTVQAGGVSSGDVASAPPSNPPVAPTLASGPPEESAPAARATTAAKVRRKPSRGDRGPVFGARDIVYELALSARRPAAPDCEISNLKSEIPGTPTVVESFARAAAPDFSLRAEPPPQPRLPAFQPPPSPRELDTQSSVPSPQSSPPPSIDDIDRNDVMAAIRELFSDGEPRSREDAIRDIARALGYQRAGAHIRDVLDDDIRTAVRRGILENQLGDGLTLAFRSIGQYDRDHLIAMLLASMDAAWTDRDAAVRNAARHMGYRRTGKEIQRTFKSAINGAIRRNLLESDGPRLRKIR